MRRLLALTIALMLGGTLGLYAFAPYLMSLVFEGSPTLTWRGVSQYAEVPGTSR